MIAGHYINYIAFSLVCLVLMTLPFLPAFREWRHPSDAAALPVSPDYSSDIDHFARRLQADVAARLGNGPATGYEDFDFVSMPVSNMNWRKASKRLIARTDINTLTPVRSVQPLYVQGSLRAGAESSFSALYATGNIELGAESEIHDWAHADGVVHLDRKSLALRRISAGTAIELGSEAWFERLQAPTLRFGSRTSHAFPPAEADQTPASFAGLPGAVQQTPSLFLFRGDCTLEADKIYRGSLVVTGFLTVGERTTVIGDVKSREGMSIGQGAWVQGAITCEKRVHVLKDAQVAGPLISENDILIGINARIGLPDANTSVSARNIIVEDGAVVHGVLWAHEIGMVKSA
jgi:cytoskeletal protein CcmA (bactofilin family)